MKTLIKRLATCEEIESVYNHIIDVVWFDNVKYSETIGKEIVEGGYEAFKNQQYKETKNEIQDLIFTTELKDNCFLYSFYHTYLDLSEEEEIVNFSFCSILKVNETMTMLDDFDFINTKDEIEAYKKSKSNKKPGRPSRPSDENIIKTNKIYFFLKDNPMANVDSTCKDFDISKSTYYRILNWLENHTVLTKL